MTIDLFAIKPGDVVTLEKDMTTVTGPVRLVDKEWSKVRGLSIEGAGWLYLEDDVVAQSEGVWEVTAVEHRISPGTHGKATVRGQKNVEVMRLDYEGRPWISTVKLGNWWHHYDDQVTDFREILSLDPEDEKTVQHLVDAVADAMGWDLKSDTRAEEAVQAMLKSLERIER